MARCLTTASPILVHPISVQDAALLWFEVDHPQPYPDPMEEESISTFGVEGSDRNMAIRTIPSILQDTTLQIAAGVRK